MTATPKIEALYVLSTSYSIAPSTVASWPMNLLLERALSGFIHPAGCPGLAVER
jgi:hypothetical protein